MGNVQLHMKFAEIKINNYRSNKVRLCVILLLLALLLLSTTIGCGSNNNNEQQLSQEDARRLVDIYAEYLTSGDPMLIEQIAEICPICIIEHEDGRLIDEPILLQCLKGQEVDLSVISACYRSSFSSDQFPLEANAMALYYSEPYVEEDVGKVFVDFTLEGPWDFSQQPEHPEDIVNHSTLEPSIEPSIFPKHDEFPEAKFVVLIQSGGGSIEEYVSKDEYAYYEYGRTGNTVNAIHFSEPDILLEFPLEVGKTWNSIYEASLGDISRMTVSTESEVVAKGVIYLPYTAFPDAYLVQRKRANLRDGEKLRDNIVYLWYVPYIGEVACIQSMDNEENEIFTQAAAYTRLRLTSYAKPSGQ